jgi:mono/diheme cytochrome c family protein
MNAEPKPATPAAGEPASAPTPLPVWLLVLTLLLLFWAAVYFDQHGGWFAAQVYSPYVSVADVERFQPRARGGPNLSRGKAVFEATCALCHNADGAGKPGQAPPLAGSDWVNAKGPNRVIHIVLLGLNGPIEVSGKSYVFSSGMTPFGGALPDDDIAAVLSYVRQAWGNQAPPVTVEQVKAVRAEVGNRAQALTVDELKGLPEELKLK